MKGPYPLSPYLTRVELRELSGRCFRATIKAWLKQEKIAFVQDADGWPKVLREVHDRRLGLAAGATPAQHSEPDFTSLKLKAPDAPRSQI